MVTHLARAALITICLCVALSAATARAGFTQVDTAFGTATALRDTSASLDWLHLNITAGLSYDDVTTALATDPDYAGWRWATPGELVTLFADYIGQPGGFVGSDNVPADIALAENFMSDLGGPLLQIPPASPGDFSRDSSTALLNVPLDLGHALYGNIDVDFGTEVTINPSLQGSSVDDSGASLFGSWLVQDVVPEPASLGLLAVGAAGLLLRRRR